MFVRPAFRRKGIGRLLVEETLQAVRQTDCSIVGLDNSGFMTDAHAPYRSFGFRDRSPSEESDIPPEYREYWVFMELNLADGSTWPQVDTLNSPSRPGRLRQPQRHPMGAFGSCTCPCSRDPKDPEREIANGREEREDRSRAAG